MLILQRGSYLVECVLGLLAQHGLGRAETNLGLRRRLVLIDAPDLRFDCGKAGIQGGCHLMGHPSLIGSIHRMFVGQVGLVRGQLNSLLGAGIQVPVVDPFLDGSNLPPYVLLAGEWVKDQRRQTGVIAVPEVLAGGRRQRFLARGCRGL